MRAYLNDIVNAYLQQAVASLDASAPAEPPRWEVPKDPSFGDLSSPVAFRLASKHRQPPQQLAQRLVERLHERLRGSPHLAWVDRVEAKSGFVNLFLAQAGLLAVLDHVRRAGDTYGHSDAGAGKSVMVEFVSANPTGPLSVAHGRQAAVGDALERLLRSQGYRVTTEYYVNDEGRQIELLGQSLRCRCLEQLGRPEPLPEEGYAGAYLIDSAARLVKAKGVMEYAGAARIVPQAEATPERLAREMLALLDQPAQLAQMAQRARSLAKPRAAAAIADLLEEVARR